MSRKGRAGGSPAPPTNRLGVALIQSGRTRLEIEIRDFLSYALAGAFIILIKWGIGEYVQLVREGQIPHNVVSTLHAIVIEVEKEWRDNPQVHEYFNNKKDMALSMASEALSSRGIKLDVNDLAGKIEAMWASTFNEGSLYPKTKPNKQSIPLFNFDPDKAN